MRGLVILAILISAYLIGSTKLVLAQLEELADIYKNAGQTSMNIAGTADYSQP